MSDHHADQHLSTLSNKSNGRKFLLPLLMGILAVALAIYIFKGCNGPAREPGEAVSSTAASANSHDTASGSIHASTVYKVKLPNDTVLNAYESGIEDRLVAFLTTDYKKLGADSLKNRWFDFDNLNFETGRAVITASSQQQINNLAAILKAFPAVHLKIGGYTDKVGNEADNKKLSDARAKAVQAALTKAGVGNQLTGAEGYGAAYARYSAAAPESDRIKDRHVSVSVR